MAANDMPDPRLKAAMAEIQAIIKRYDIAAVVNLVSQSHLEFLYEISPSWSCSKVEPQPDGAYVVRIRALSGDFPNPAAQKKCLEDTSGMFICLREQADRTSAEFKMLIDALAAKFHIEHMTKDETTPRKRT